MPRHKPQPRQAAAESGPPPAAVWLSRAAFVLAASIVLARALMLETLRNPLDVQPDAESVPRGPGAGTGLLLDLLCCVPALLVLARRVLDRSFALRFAWSLVPMALLALWTVASTIWAGDKFAAAVGGTHWLCASVLLWTAAQLARDWRHLRLVGAVCVGLLLVEVGQGLYYRFVEFPDFVASWNRDRDKILRQRGWEPGSFIATQFEKRVLSGEMMGFTSSPNSYGAVLVLLMFVGYGVAMQRIADGDGIAWAAVPAGGVVVAGFVIALVGSRTAVATPVLGAIALAAFAALRRPLARHSRLAYALVVCAIFAGAAALVGHGLYHGTLFHESLTFRWRYWVAAMKIFTAHRLAGVGWENFGAHYLAVRLPVAAEEIKDPHNFLVRFATELGAVGFALVVTWLLTLAWELTQRKGPAAESSDDRPTEEEEEEASGQRSSPLGTIAAMGVLAVLMNAVASMDWSQAPAYNVLEVMRRLGFLCLFLVGAALSAIRSADRPVFDARPAPWVVYAMLVGLALFLVHNLVDFSLFEPGLMFLFAWICGAALGIRIAEAPLRGRSSGAAVLAALAIASAAWLVLLGGFAVPVALAENEADAGDEALRTRRFGEAVEHFDRARGLVGYNADYAFRAARAALSDPRPSDADLPVRLLDAAIALDPNRPQYWLHRAYARLRGRALDLVAVRSDYGRALYLDPNNVDVRIEYGDMLRRFGDTAAAAAEYREALRYNDLLSPDEPKRLPPTREQQVRKALAEVTAQMEK